MRVDIILRAVHHQFAAFLNGKFHVTGGGSFSVREDIPNRGRIGENVKEGTI